MSNDTPYSSQIDKCCDLFEKHWQREKTFTIEEILQKVSEEQRSTYLKSLLSVEIELRSRDDDSPTAEELHARFPSFTDVVDGVWADPGIVDSLAGRETVPPQTSPGDSDEVPASTALRIPRQLGRYRIIRKLGQGAMGSVFLAHDEQLDRQVALKIPRGDLQPNREMRLRFEREAQAAAALHHPNICPIHDIGEFEGVHYICMGYIEGISLTRYAIAESGLSEQRIAELVLKMAKALAVAHEAGFIHRDLKPANVMVNLEDEPVILDFGLARRIDRCEDLKVTQTGTTIGSPAYMSPEQVDGDQDKVGPHSDIYSLGVLLYELLTGRIPFEGSMASVMGQIMTKEPEKPSEYRKDLSVRLENICQRMMAKDPSKRHPSMHSVVAGLQEYLDKYTESPVPPAPPTPDIDDPGTRRRQQIEGLITSGDYGQAEKLMVALSRESDESLRSAATWAAAELPGLRKTREEVRAGRQEMYSTAVTLMKSHDYRQAMRLLEEYPYDLRTPKMQELLEQAETQVNQIERLRKEIQTARHRGDNVAALSLVRQLLEIKPGDRRARELQEQLTRRNAPPLSRILGNKAPSFVDRMPPGAQWIVVSSILVTVCCFGAYQWSRHFLDADDPTLLVARPSPPSDVEEDPVVPDSDWRDQLLPLTLPKVTHGWQKMVDNSATFVGARGNPAFLSPDEPGHRYEVDLRFTTDDSVEFAALVFPTYDSQCALILQNHESKFGGLEQVRGEWTFLSSGTAVSSRVLPAQNAGIRVRVDSGEIRTDIQVLRDDVIILEWEGPTQDLGLANHWQHDKGRQLKFGISFEEGEGSGTKCAVSRLRFRELPDVDPGPSFVPSGTVTDLHKGLSGKDCTLAGEFELANGTLRVRDRAAGSARIVYPFIPARTYQLKMKVIRRSEARGFGLRIPVGDSTVDVMLAGGAGSGLGKIDGKKFTTNETFVEPSDLVFQLNQSTDISVTVGKTFVAVEANGKPFFRFDGDFSRLNGTYFEQANPRSILVRRWNGARFDITSSLLTSKETRRTLPPKLITPASREFAISRYGEDLRDVIRISDEQGYSIAAKGSKYTNDGQVLEFGFDGKKNDHEAFSKEILPRLARLKGPISIQPRNDARVDLDALIAVAKSAELVAVDLGLQQKKLKASHIQHLAGSRFLREIRYGTAPLTEPLADALADLRQVQSVDLLGAYYEAPTLRKFVQASSARELFLGWNLDDAKFEVLHDNVAIQSLWVWAEAGFTDKSIPILESMKNLKRLSIHRTGVSEAGRQRISEMGLEHFEFVPVQPQ